VPILPDNKAKYPTNWKEISIRIKNRAGWRCEFCGVGHGEWGWREGEKFVSAPKGPLRDAGYIRPPFNVSANDGRILHFIEIVLTTAHLDHDEANCTDGNLRALCQQCHNRYDAKHRRQGIVQKKYAGIAPLFPDL
jgi:hypothetical protein